MFDIYTTNLMLKTIVISSVTYEGAGPPPPPPV